ncbi:DgyrCDS177 [Dimorphilus gyrociliatus]|uniref:DgyrCDS177 n=1 Tax=Dimorphilus gyrociliatus TaxID=2664684 RepID=A0A7I8V3T3_9ANNE|nr:DgyrCDS177 [Dimorphilus gyrociliatus]
MTSQVDENINLIMKGVSAALKLDRESSHIEAYRQYLKCIQFISQTLQKDALNLIMSYNTHKCLTLAKQCTDRLADMFENTTSKPPILIASPSPSLTSLSNIDIGQITPMDLAIKQNQKIIEAYSSRRCGVDGNLSLVRKLSENIAIAKTREETISKRLAEKRKILEAKATTSMSSLPGLDSDENERRMIYIEVLEYEQKKKWPGILREQLNSRPNDFLFAKAMINRILSTEDHPITILLTKQQQKILNRTQPLTERHAHHLANYNPQPALTSSVQSLKSPQSFKGEELWEEMDDLFEDEVENPEMVTNLEDEALERHVKDISRDTREGLEKVVTMLIITFNDLKSQEGYDVIFSTVEPIYFKPIWHSLLTLFRLANRAEEEGISKTMTKLSDASPINLKVNPKFRLSDDRNTYKQAVDELAKCCDLHNPLAKLESIVLSSRKIVECVQEHYEKTQLESLPVLGADDLVPILSFVVVKTCKPELVTECRAIEQFTHEDYLMGEEGYCLASLQTAVRYVANMFNQELT